jgi:hypothetical protein
MPAVEVAEVEHPARVSARLGRGTGAVVIDQQIRRARNVKFGDQPGLVHAAAVIVRPRRRWGR